MLGLLLQMVGELVVTVNAKTDSNNKKKKKEKPSDEHTQTHMQKKD